MRRVGERRRWNLDFRRCTGKAIHAHRDVTYRSAQCPDAEGGATDKGIRRGSCAGSATSTHGCLLLQATRPCVPFRISDPPEGCVAGAFSFGRYEVLQGALYPPPSTALQLLYRLANDVGIIGIMEKHRWKVGLLSEMPPEGKVGISQMCVLGYNVNKGQEIALRLRTDDRKGFRKYVTIRQTLIHELTHMVWSEHDDNFKQLNSQLLQECDQFLNQRGFLLDGAAALDEVEIATQQPDAGRRLGGEVMHKSAAAAAKDAALRRAGKFQKSHRDASRS